MSKTYIESVLISEKDEFVATLERKFKIFNILYFDGKLNIDGLVFRSTDHSRVVLGVARNQSSDLGFELLFNTFYKDFDKLDWVLIHELIHIYQLQVLKLSWEEIMAENSTGHGPSFMKKAIKILQDHNIDTFNEIYGLISEFSKTKRASKNVN